MTADMHTLLPAGEVCVICQEGQKVTRSTPFFAETGALYNETSTNM